MIIDILPRMAARSAIAPARWRRPFLTWLDGTGRGWAVPLLIALFVIAWFAFLVLAHQGVDLHYDTLETWNVGRFFAWGTVNHPPLMGWVARVWTRVFPLTDWSFQLLAMVNAGVALWAVDLITRRFACGDKRIFLLLLLMLTPAYQFHAQRFNANSVLLAVWPLAIYAFLRSYESRTVAWSVLAGALAALAMLGKYYSVFLIASFALAAIIHSGRAAYFRSPAPWVSIVTGLIVLGPHLHWLATTGATPFQHAMEAQSGVALPRAADNAAMFLLGLAAALAPAAVVWMLTAERRLSSLPRDLGQLSPGLRLLGLIFIFSVMLPVIVTVAVGTNMPSLWALQGLFLAPLLVVCAARFEIERFYTINLAIVVIGVAVLAITVAAPIYARSELRDDNDRVFYSAAAREMTTRWREATGTPLTSVSGDNALAFATAFYSPDHPIYRRPFLYQYAWGMPRPETLDKGWTGICFARDPSCGDWMTRVAARAHRPVRIAFTVERTLGGRTARADIVALMTLPADEPVHEPQLGSIPEDFGASRRE